MSQIEDNLCFDSEGIGLTEPTITLEGVQNLAKRSTTITLINTEEKEKNNTNVVMNCIDLSESEFNESNESKSLKRKKKRIGKRVKRGKNISLQMRLKKTLSFSKIIKCIAIFAKITWTSRIRV
jgi:hypothetical protein